VMLALHLGRQRGLPVETGRALVCRLAQLPGLVARTLALEPQVKALAQRYGSAGNFLYLGRGVSHAVALEGALKLKEISYIHAEGYAAAEMKHGPIALVDEHLPIVFVAPRTKSIRRCCRTWRKYTRAAGTSPRSPRRGMMSSAPWSSIASPCPRPRRCSRQF